MLELISVSFLINETIHPRKLWRRDLIYRPTLVKRNKVNNRLDHPKDYYYFNVSYLRKCLWGNIWKCNNLILNIMKTKQITEYIVEAENMSRDRRSAGRFVLGRQKVFALLQSGPGKKTVLKLAMMACRLLVYWGQAFFFFFFSVLTL